MFLKVLLGAVLVGIAVFVVAMWLTSGDND